VSHPFKLRDGDWQQGAHCRLWVGDLYKKQAFVVVVPTDITQFVWDIIDLKFYKVPRHSFFLVWSPRPKRGGVPVYGSLSKDSARTFRMVDRFVKLRKGKE
jgi:hypothetical protein